MIVSIFLRNIKTYRRIQYIPLSTGEKFCGLVGANGVGKSSILEALDTIFNDREWNLNIVTKRSGTQSTNPYIVPVFLIHKSFIKKTSKRETAQKVSDLIWSISQENINPSQKQNFESFEKHRKALSRNFNQEDFFLLPLGLDNSKKISMGIFDLGRVVDALKDKDIPHEDQDRPLPDNVSTTSELESSENTLQDSKEFPEESSEDVGDIENLGHLEK